MSSVLVLSQNVHSRKQFDSVRCWLSYRNQFSTQIQPTLRGNSDLRLPNSELLTNTTKKSSKKSSTKSSKKSSKNSSSSKNRSSFKSSKNNNNNNNEHEESVWSSYLQKAKNKESLEKEEIEEFRGLTTPEQKVQNKSISFEGYGVICGYSGGGGAGYGNIGGHIGGLVSGYVSDRGISPS